MRTTIRTLTIAVLFPLFAALTACGAAHRIEAALNKNNTYTIGGSASGLGAGLSVVLQDNGGDNLTVSANGTFTFATKITSGGAYAVTVLTQPTGQNCTVTGGSGTASANVSTVAVACTNTVIQTYSIGGSVSGLGTGLSVVLQDNGGDNLSVSTNGTFTFATKIASGGAYAVTVLTQPTGQHCTVTAGSGTVTANVTGVAVSCASIGAGSYTVGGTVYGLASGGSVTLKNGGDSTPMTANGIFTFATTVAGGSTYSASVSSQPTGQSCSVTNGSGTATNANISNIEVVCTHSASNASLTGNYGLESYTVLTSANAPDGFLGTIAFSSPNAVVTAQENKAGVISSDPASTFPYSVTTDSVANGFVAIGNNGGAVGALLGADANAVVASDIKSGDDPQFYAAVLTGSGKTVASLQGTFYFAVVGGGVGNQSILLEAVFDGVGSVATTSTHNTSGVITTTTNTSSYSVNSDGTFSAPTLDLSGALSADGNVAVYNHMVSGQYPSSAFGVRTGTTSSNASLDGSYTLVFYSATVADLTTDVIFDGNGHWFILGTTTDNSGGTISTSTGGSGTYAVNSDGTMTLTNPTLGITYNGAVAVDGNSLALALISAGDSQFMAAGLRQ